MEARVELVCSVDLNPTPPALRVWAAKAKWSSQSDSSYRSVSEWLCRIRVYDYILPKSREHQLLLVSPSPSEIARPAGLDRSVCGRARFVAALPLCQCNLWAWPRQTSHKQTDWLILGPTPIVIGEHKCLIWNWWIWIRWNNMYVNSIQGTIFDCTFWALHLIYFTQQFSGRIDNLNLAVEAVRIIIKKL